MTHIPNHLARVTGAGRTGAARGPRLAALAVALGLLAAPGAVAGQAPAGLPGVVTAAELAAWQAGPERGRLVLLHAARDRAAWDSARIAGSRFVPFAAYTATVDGLVTEVPPVAALDSLLEGLGVGDSSLVVVTGEVLPAARLVFTLHYLGLEGRTHWLDGGVDAWRAEGHPVASGAAAPAAPPAPGRLTPRPRPDLVVSADWVHGRLDDPAVALLDARSPEEFLGTAPDAGPRAGHIPGAANLDWRTLLRDGRLRPGAELRAEFRAAGAREDGEVVTYCGVGTRASFLYLVSAALGYRTRLYDGSMAEWAAREDLPVARLAPD